LATASPEIVVAMHRDHRLVDVRHAVHQHRDEGAELLRQGVADGVGNVDRAGPRPDRALDAAAQEVVLAARAVLGRPLDVGAQIAGVGDAVDDRLMDRLGRHLQLELHMQRAGRDEGVDARPGGAGQRLPGPVDVLARGPRQAGHCAVADLPRDLGDRLEIAVGGDRKTGLDDIDAELLENHGDADLLVEVHRRAGRLLAVPQGRVEDHHAVLVIREIHRPNLLDFQTKHPATEAGSGGRAGWKAGQSTTPTSRRRGKRATAGGPRPTPDRRRKQGVCNPGPPGSTSD
jgi:hypothetical protein